MQHQHAVSVLDRVLQIVGDHDAGEVVVDYLLIRQFQNQFGRFRIQGCRMFIQQQKRSVRFWPRRYAKDKFSCTVIRGAVPIFGSWKTRLM